MIPQLAACCVAFAASALIKKYVHEYFARIPANRQRDWNGFFMDKGMYLLGATTTLCERLVYGTCLVPILAPLCGSFIACMFAYSIPTVLSAYLSYRATQYEYPDRPHWYKDKPSYVVLDILNNCVFYASMVNPVISAFWLIPTALARVMYIGFNQYRESDGLLATVALACIWNAIANTLISDMSIGALKFVSDCGMNTLNDFVFSMIIDAGTDMAPLMV